MECLCPGLSEILFRDFSVAAIALMFKPNPHAGGEGAGDRVITISVGNRALTNALLMYAV